jgi:hypothetical protein
MKPIERERFMKSFHPDISGIFSAKLHRRQVLAQLSWEEKVAIVDRMRQLLPQGMWKNKNTDHNMIDKPHESC